MADAIRFNDLDNVQFGDVVGDIVGDIPTTDAPVQESTSATEQKAKKSSTVTASKLDFEKKAKEGYAAMTDEQKAAAASAASTLLFIGYASFESRRGSYSTGEKDPRDPKKTLKKTGPYSVGTCWESTTDIDVPDIPAEYSDLSKPVPKDVLLRTKHKAAGEMFTLSDIEALVLFSRVEYSSNFIAKQNGAKGSVRYKASAYGGADQPTYPTPAFNLASGASHDMNVIIDQKNPDGTWSLKPNPEFAKFANELPKSQRTKRAPKEKAPSVDKTIMDSAAIRALLFG